MQFDDVFNEAWEKVKLPSRKVPGRYYIEKTGFLSLVEIVREKFGDSTIPTEKLLSMDETGVWTDSEGENTKIEKLDAKFLLARISGLNTDDFEYDTSDSFLSSVDEKSGRRHSTSDTNIGNDYKKTHITTNIAAEDQNNSSILFSKQKFSPKNTPEPSRYTQKKHDNYTQKLENYASTPTRIPKPILQPKSVKPPKFEESSIFTVSDTDASAQRRVNKFKRKLTNSDQEDAPGLLTPKEESVNSIETSTPISQAHIDNFSSSLSSFGSSEARKLQNIIENKEQDIVYRDLQISKLQETLAGVEAQFEKQNKAFNELQAQLEAEKEDVSVEKSAQIEYLSRQLAEEKNGHKHLKSENGELVKELEKLSESLANVETMQTVVNKNESEKIFLRGEVERLEQTNSELKKAQYELQNKYKDLSRSTGLEISSLKLKLIELTEKANDKHSKGLKISPLDIKRSFEIRQKQYEKLLRLEKRMKTFALAEKYGDKTSISKSKWPIFVIMLLFLSLIWIHWTQPSSKEISFAPKYCDNVYKSRFSFMLSPFSGKKAAVSRFQYNAESLDRSIYDQSFSEFKERMF